MNVCLNPIAQAAFNILNVATCDLDDVRAAVTEAARGYKVSGTECILDHHIERIIDMVIEMVEAAFDEQDID